MNISIPVEDRQPIRITPRFPNSQPSKPRVLASDLKPRKSRLAPTVKKLLTGLLYAAGLLILAAIALAFPDLRFGLAIAILFWLVMRGIREATRKGVEQGLASGLGKLPPVV